MFTSFWFILRFFTSRTAFLSTLDIVHFIMFFTGFETPSKCGCELTISHNCIAQQPCSIHKNLAALPFPAQPFQPHSSPNQWRAHANWIWHRYLSKVRFAMIRGETQRVITAVLPMKSSSRAHEYTAGLKA